MRIYRAGGEARVSARAWIEQLGRALAAAHLACDADEARAILVDAGELESAIEDARRPACDGSDSISRTLRALACAAGHALIAARRRERGLVRRALHAASGALERLRSHSLPSEVERRAPEGFAHYGLFPEMYEEAAARFAAGRNPGPILCLGLRSIGTSLAGVVHAALAERGFPVESFTLRPRGHPFDRRPILDGALASRMARSGAHFVIVDEGPGLSGSSLLGTAAALERLGIPGERITLLPGHLPDERRLTAPNWGRYTKYAGAFENVFSPESLLDLCDGHSIEDISAGRWRNAIGVDAPVHPQHERRKFLARNSRGHPIVMFRFAGFGRHGAIRRARAEALAEAGFGPRVIGLRDGFLGLAFVDGTPSMADPVRIGHYAAFCARTFATDTAADHESLRAMAEDNLAECLGEEWRGRAGRHFDRLARCDCPAVILDGRMAAHEWIGTTSGFVKVDAIDHGLDHFEPGPHDIAWDLAGAIVELDLEPSARDVLIEQSGDPDIARRLPAVEIAYRAFRLAYCTQSARTLADTPEGPRFAAQAEKHAAALRGLL